MTYRPTSSTLASLAVVDFDVPWSEKEDTETTNPVDRWFEIMPGATLAVEPDAYSFGYTTGFQ